MSDIKKRKVIYVDDLREAIVEDKEIRGPAFAAIMRHLNAIPDAEQCVDTAQPGIQRDEVLQ